MILAALLGCTAEADTPEADTQPAGCPTWSEPTALGTMQDERLEELSGLALSTAHPGVLWTHNDSGDEARIFAVGLDGGLLGEFPLDGALAADWEAMSLGPDGRLWVGDIGDNKQKRDDAHLLSFAEPDPAAPGTLRGVEDRPVSWQGGPADAESMLVDPVDGAVYAITKRADGESRVHRLEGNTLVAVAELKLGKDPFEGAGYLTDAAITPDGRWIYLRTYTHVFALRRPAGTDFAAAFSGEPCLPPTPSERQGEAIAAAADGFLTVSEGKGATIWKVALQ